MPRTAGHEGGSGYVEADLEMKARCLRRLTEPRAQTVQPPEAGQHSAIRYSLIVSCQRQGKDPLAYLEEVLARLPRLTNQNDLRQRTPRFWQADLVVIRLPLGAPCDVSMSTIETAPPRDSHRSPPEQCNCRCRTALPATTNPLPRRER